MFGNNAGTIETGMLLFRLFSASTRTPRDKRDPFSPPIDISCSAEPDLNVS